MNLTLDEAYKMVLDNLYAKRKEIDFVITAINFYEKYKDKVELLEKMLEASDKSLILANEEIKRLKSVRPTAQGDGK